jgi:hypothetical protein
LSKKNQIGEMRFGVKGVFVCGNIVVCFDSYFLCNSLLHNDIYYIFLVFLPFASVVFGGWFYLVVFKDNNIQICMFFCGEVMCGLFKKSQIRWGKLP